MLCTYIYILYIYMYYFINCKSTKIALNNMEIFYVILNC